MRAPRPRKDPEGPTASGFAPERRESPEFPGRGPGEPRAGSRLAGAPGGSGSLPKVPGGVLKQNRVRHAAGERELVSRSPRRRRTGGPRAAAGPPAQPPPVRASYARTALAPRADEPQAPRAAGRRRGERGALPPQLRHHGRERAAERPGHAERRGEPPGLARVADGLERLRGVRACADVDRVRPFVRLRAVEPTRGVRRRGDGARIPARVPRRRSPAACPWTRGGPAQTW